MKRGRVENLNPLNTVTKERQREICQAGQRAGTKVKKEKKLMSGIYAEILAGEHNIKIDGEMKKMPGDKLLKNVTMKLLLKNDANTMNMLKEIREATEGSKTKIESSININMEDAATKAVIDEFGINPKN